MTPEGPAELPTEEQEAAFAASRADRDRTLEAVHRVEAALGMAAPGRESEWTARLAHDVRALVDAVDSERAESLRPDSLLSMIGRDYPRRFGARIRHLREQHDDIVRQAASLQGQLEGSAGNGADFDDLRSRVGWLVRAIRHRRARESDLVYEAITLDLGHSGG